MIEKLKEKYKGYNQLSRFMSNEQYSLTESYINLVIVKQEEVKEREKNLQQQEEGEKSFRNERLTTYESLHTVANPIGVSAL